MRLFIIGIFFLFNFLELKCQILDSIIDTLDFETKNNILTISNDSNNIWEIGKPSKTQFNSAYLGNRAILTDSINNYPINNYSSFIIPFYLFSGIPEITFWHKYHTQKNKDGGYLEYSFDNGLNWNVLDNTTYSFFYSDTNYRQYSISAPNIYGPMDSLSNNKIGFSGNSNTWEKCTIFFDCIAVKKATPFLLKFVFVSDSIQSAHNGWIIDQILLKNQYDCGTAVEEKNLNNNFEIYPNPFSNSIIVNSNLNNSFFKIFDLFGKLILKGEILKFPTELNTTKIPKGIYVLELNIGNETFERKKIIKH